ncbi:MAG TPA: 50S ribosomal protein L19, partial [Candidatus Polarisedimenticolaceae bacterium]|nr:50S ribosomal protein L19 [Candidatus Polarisedimenticolaceae bacterium]
RIREGNKQRVQIFEGVVIRTHRLGSLSATITVRRIASGVGVEKTYLLHSPNVDKVEIMRRAKVRRNFLSYLRGRRGKSARLQEMGFDKTAANAADGSPLISEDEAAGDAAVTEVDAEENQDALNDADISTDEIAKEENKQAKADDASPDDGGTEAGDESEIEREEAEQKIDKPGKDN